MTRQAVAFRMKHGRKKWRSARILNRGGTISFAVDKCSVPVPSLMHYVLLPYNNRYADFPYFNQMCEIIGDSVPDTLHATRFGLEEAVSEGQENHDDIEEQEEEQEDEESGGGDSPVGVSSCSSVPPPPPPRTPVYVSSSAPAGGRGGGKHGYRPSSSSVSSTPGSSSSFTPVTSSGGSSSAHCSDSGDGDSGYRPRSNASSSSKLQVSKRRKKGSAVAVGLGDALVHAVTSKNRDAERRTHEANQLAERRKTFMRELLAKGCVDTPGERANVMKFLLNASDSTLGMIEDFIDLTTEDGREAFWSLVETL